MNLLEDRLLQYAESHTSPESDLLQKINRETHSQVLMPQMLSGHLQGRVLACFSKMIRPANILEIGTYTGYATICLAEGLAADGRITTIDINEELEERVRGYFDQSIFKNQIDYRIGDATTILPALEVSFDLVFIDADKTNYGRYYELVFEKVATSGFIVADNVLWSGKVLEDAGDEDTEAIKAFNLMVQEDERVENVLFPVRDGLMVVRKK